MEIGKKEVITLPKRLRMIAKKIGHQFPTSGEGRLMFSVVEQAIMDIANPLERGSAIRYLKDDIVHASLCGVCSDWIRRVIADGGVSIHERVEI